MDVTIVDGIPVTTPARTLIDVAAVAPRDAVEEAVDDAFRRGLVSIPRLEALGRQGRPGVVTFRSILDARDGSASVPASVFETRLLRLLKRARVTAPAVQYQVRSRGRLVAVVDFAWPTERVALEADGFRWHSARSRFEHDRARRNELTLHGWRIIQLTWSDLTRRPAALIETVQEALARGH